MLRCGIACEETFGSVIQVWGKCHWIGWFVFSDDKFGISVIG